MDFAYAGAQSGASAARAFSFVQPFQTLFARNGTNQGNVH
jgi:hypothetical protein